MDRLQNHNVESKKLVIEKYVLNDSKRLKQAKHKMLLRYKCDEIVQKSKRITQKSG